MVRRIGSARDDAVLGSPEPESLFAPTDVRRLIDHRTRFIASLLGGPAACTDEHPHRAHAQLPIRRRDVDLRSGLLHHCLRGLDVAVAPAEADGALLFGNARCFQRFPLDGDGSAQPRRRLPMLDRAKAGRRPDPGRAFTREVDVTSGARTLSLEVRLRGETFGRLTGHHRRGPRHLQVP